MTDHVARFSLHLTLSPHTLRHQLPERRGAEAAADIPRRVSFGDHGGDRGVDGACGVDKMRLLLARAVPFQQLRGGEDQRGRVGDVAPGDVGGGAVGRLRHGVVEAGVERAAQAKAAGEFGGEVREDVAEHVGGDDDVEAGGIAHHVGHHGVHQDLVDREAGILRRRGAADVQEHAIRYAQHIGLVHHREVLAPAHGEGAGGMRDALAAEAGDAPQ